VSPILPPSIHADSQNPDSAFLVVGVVHHGFGVLVLYTSKEVSGSSKPIALDWLHRLACTGGC